MEKETDWLKMLELDIAAEKAGGYVSMCICNDDMHYDYRAIVEYCKDRDIKPTELTEKEFELFVL